MGRPVKWFCAVAALVAALVLCACSPAGTYKLTQVTSDEVTYTADDLAAFEAAGIITQLELCTDGTAVITMADQAYLFAWEESVFCSGDDVLPFTVEHRQLTFTIDDLTYTFTRQ